MTDSTYSAVGDLLLGDLPVSTEISKQGFVNDAADEVDSIIGRRYVTPINVSGTGQYAVPRHAALFVKRAANHLATGRLILAVAAGGEDGQLHAYGWSLVNGALKALEQIAEGSYDLPEAQPISTGGAVRPTAPTVTNSDSASGVDAFYGYLSAPAPVLPLDGPVWIPGDNV
jgi:hypothetical protein